MLCANHKMAKIHLSNYSPLEVTHLPSYKEKCQWQKQVENNMFKMRYQMIRYLKVKVSLRTANIPITTTEI